MNYTTETIQQAAQQIAAGFKTAILAQARTGGEGPTIAQIEAEMREALRQIGQQALSLCLSSLQPTPETERPCPCGGTLHYQRMREATVISVFGKTTYTRAYYAGCVCQQGHAPLDQQFGLEPGAVTAGLAHLLALAGIAFSYDESPQWLHAYLLFDVAANTVRSETEGMGALQVEQEDHLIEQSQDPGYLQARQRAPGAVPPRLYGSLDAAKVRTEPRPKKGEVKAAHEDWRDMKVLCWFETEAVPPSQQSKRQQQKAARQQPALRAKKMQYFCDIAEAETFGKLVWATGCTVKADLCPDLVFLGDGAPWIWNLVTHYYPQATQIVDWYHAEEHLEKVAAAAFANLTHRTLWLEDTTQALWEGQVEEVIAACDTLAATCVQAAQAGTYFSNNSERMRYARFRMAGYMIGSGTIESGCKQIVTQRLKLPGAQWHVTGAVHTAKARAAWLNGHWPTLCAQRSALPLAV
jgi:hypothetical protein